MKKQLLISFLLLISAVVTQGSHTDGTSDQHSLVEAERTFAKTSAAKGMREAFLANLAEDSILFHPHAVDGRTWWRAQPDRPGVLTWQPILADTSRAGDLGYTTGPWEFREKSLNDKPVAHGNYVTIWKRQSDGQWKVAVDLGTSNPPPETPVPELEFSGKFRNNNATTAEQGVHGVVAQRNIAAERSALQAAENDFSRLLAAKGTTYSLLSWMADDVRLFRMGAFPLIGKEATRAVLESNPVRLTSESMKTDVSRSGDLGYSYGQYELTRSEKDKQRESGNYLRIWKKHSNGKWQVVLDLLDSSGR